jgi:hypothetical protein
MWWRLVGSAIEHAASLAGQEIEFQKLFLKQEEDDDESATLADALGILVKKWPDGFTASDVTEMINIDEPNEDEQTLRDFLAPKAQPKQKLSSNSIGMRLKDHLDDPVYSGERTLVLRSQKDTHKDINVFFVRSTDDSG